MTDFTKLPNEKKFFLIADSIRDKKINNLKEFKNALDKLSFADSDFTKTFVTLLDGNKIGKDILDLLDSEDNPMYAGPHILSNRWIKQNIGLKKYCRYFSPNEQNKMSVCKGVRESETKLTEQVINLYKI